MRVHNYGSDYAFQQKKKQDDARKNVQVSMEVAKAPEVEAMQEEEVVNDNDTIQSEGEESMDGADEAEEAQTAKRTYKKRKAKQ